MSIRFSTLNYRQVRCNTSEEVNAKEYSKGRTILVMNDLDGRYLGFVNPSAGYDVMCISVTAGQELFQAAHELFYCNKKLEYLPVLNSEGRLICFCYQDFDHEKVREYVLELMSFNNLIGFNQGIAKGRHIRIWGFSEIAYYFHCILRKQSVSHEVTGELWEYFAEDYIETRPAFSQGKAEQTLDFLAEGNYGLPIAGGAFGKTVLEWHDKDWKILYDYYKLNCRYEGVLSLKETQCRVSGMIQSGQPFMMARIGNTEISILKEFIEKKHGVLNHYSYFWLDYLYHCCGFFSDQKDSIQEDHVDLYSEMTLKALQNCDFNVCWGNENLASGLNFILNEYESPSSKRVFWDDLETPACCFNPDTGVNALSGKRILVISPFIQTIRRQFPLRELVHTGEATFPDCQLIMYPAPETQMGQTLGYNSWFEIFNKICADLKGIDFDIALIGAGAYGFPLAYEIREMGKQAISLSSYLANWFGIKMKRYCAYSTMNCKWNQHWSFLEETPPAGYENIEAGCYWR